MDFEQIDVTGCRITGAMTIAGEIGPKHHGLILGRGVIDGVIYIAELVTSGYQITSVDEFKSRYWRYGDISLEPVPDQEAGLVVARKALLEIASNAKAKYNLITNNCESFVNRASKNTSTSTQVLTAVGVVMLVSAIWVLMKKK